MFHFGTASFDYRRASFYSVDDLCSYFHLFSSDESMYHRIAVCIDDDPHTMRIVQQTLRRMGYRVEIAHSRAEAIRLASELKPALAYVSNEMDGIDAMALYHNMQKVSERTKGLLLTSLGTSYMVMVTGQHGVNQVLVKPIDQFPLMLPADE